MGLRLSAETLAFSSREFLRLIERIGLTGTWGWAFATHEQVWSPGVFHILGLEPGFVHPSYALLCSLVHPEDRAVLDTEAEMRWDGLPRNHTVRILRPDGSVRIVECRSEVFVGPDGRPRAARGLLLDVTDQERLNQVLARERAIGRALFEEARIFSFRRSFSPAPEVTDPFAPPPEAVMLTGLPYEHMAEDSFRVMPIDAREASRESFEVGYARGQPFTQVHPFILAGGQRADFRTSPVPIRDWDGLIEEWILFVRPAVGRALRATGQGRQALETMVEGRHLRAARNLLGWTMMDLAQASGLSFSTVRRLEEDGESTAARSRHRAVAALRAAGILFSLIDGDLLAVARI